MNDKIFLVGNVRYTDNAEDMIKLNNAKESVDLIIKLQVLTEELVVVKVDLSTDAFKCFNYKHL
jgi:hypothetical protein